MFEVVFFQEEITVLGLEHLKIAFGIYGCGMGLTFLAFIAELIVGRK